MSKRRRSLASAVVAMKFEVAPVDTSALTGTHDKDMPLNLEIVAFEE